jgi:hypothetical protein
MRFSSTTADIDCYALTDPHGDAIAGVAGFAADLLNDLGYAVFRIGRLRLGEQPSRDLALALMHALRDAVVDRGAPAEIRVEVDAPQKTIMPTPTRTRTMLPHHDGQHASFLTPSVLDVPQWEPRWRTFSEDGYTTTHSHKLYQAIFITDPGDGLSVTTVYDLLHAVADAYHHRFGHYPTPAKAADWIGVNLRAAVVHRREYGGTYPTLGGLLGLSDPALLATALIRADDPVADRLKARFPQLSEYADGCPCGGCVGETLRVFCRVTTQSLGMSTARFQEAYESCVVTERFDLLVTHNITMNHGGLEGGATRVLEPIYLAVTEPAGDEYEAWLSRQWRLRTFEEDGQHAQ